MQLPDIKCPESDKLMQELTKINHQYSEGAIIGIEGIIKIYTLIQDSIDLISKESEEYHNAFNYINKDNQ